LGPTFIHCTYKKLSSSFLAAPAAAGLAFSSFFSSSFTSRFLAAATGFSGSTFAAPLLPSIGATFSGSLASSFLREAFFLRGGSSTAFSEAFF
jgi:hypothetical protein